MIVGNSNAELEFSSYLDGDDEMPVNISEESLGLDTTIYLTKNEIVSLIKHFASILEEDSGRNN